MKATHIGLCLVLAVMFAPTFLFGQVSSPASEEGERFEFTSYVAVEEYFDEIGYTAETWLAGDRSVPRLFLTQIPERWRDKYAQEVTVKTKKRLFFRALAPLILRSNELITQERDHLMELSSRMNEGEDLSPEESQQLVTLARSYKVIDEESAAVGPEEATELLRRVDIVPVSLALSQSAEESGWGTSRFADQGNSLFGQWAWGSDAIKPEQQREGMGNYGLAAFETPLGSVASYMRNLNTHGAYEKLREKRAGLRQQKTMVTGNELVPTLDRYSERGEEYVKSLQSIIRVNKLAATDSTYLRKMAPVYMVPVGEQSE